MFHTPKKQKQQKLNSIIMDAKENNLLEQKSLINSNLNTTNTPIPTTTIVFENGTLFGALTTADDSTNAAKLSGTSLTIPEIVISASSSSNSLNRSRCEISRANSEESAVESTALLENTTITNTTTTASNDSGEEPVMLQDEFDQFILNRSTSESNILDSSIYSELQFPPSQHGGSIVGVNVHNTSSSNGGGYQSNSSSGRTVTAVTQTTPNSRQTKRTKRKHRTKSKCTATAASLAATVARQRASPTHYPPRYTAIYMDPHHNQLGNVINTTQHHHLHHHTAGGAANALGQIASAAASSPFLNAPVADSYMQQFHYFQQRPMVTTMAPMPNGVHRHHRSLFDGVATTVGIENPLNVHTAATSPTDAPAGGNGGRIISLIRLSFRKLFSRSSLPYASFVLGLGGIAVTLTGIVLGSAGLIEHSTEYLSSSLLAIGIGVSMLVICGALWRLSIPYDIDECPCYRHMEMCNSPYCNSGHYLYPEFQHRPPPPSYLTSLNECAGMSLLFHPTASAQQAAYSSFRVNTPPPLYRSTNSLSVFSTSSTTQPITTVVPNINTSTMGIVPDHSVLAMSQAIESLQHQTRPFIKELNYLELD